MKREQFLHNLKKTKRINKFERDETIKRTTRTKTKREVSLHLGRFNQQE